MVIWVMTIRSYDQGTLEIMTLKCQPWDMIIKNDQSAIFHPMHLEFVYVHCMHMWRVRVWKKLVKNCRFNNYCYIGQQLVSSIPVSGWPAGNTGETVVMSGKLGKVPWNLEECCKVHLVVIGEGNKWVTPFFCPYSCSAYGTHTTTLPPHAVTLTAMY